MKRKKQESPAGLEPWQQSVYIMVEKLHMSEMLEKEKGGKAHGRQ